MAGGIRPRLDYLKSPAVKQLVSDAVAAQKQSPKPKGDKLLADLNKAWADALKGFKQYEDMLAQTERVVMAALKTDLDSKQFAELQNLVSAVQARLKPIAASVTKFENAEDAIRTLYGMPAARRS